MIAERLILTIWLVFILPQDETITDQRDGQVYHLTEIAGQTWIRENIRFEPAHEFDMVKKHDEPDYGTYYSWDSAGDACPAGFHLPTLEEWLVRMHSYEGSANPRGGRFVHKDALDTTLQYGGLFNEGRFVATGRMGLFWTATDTTSSFGEEGEGQQPVYIGIHVYGDYTVKDSINVEPTWSNSKVRLFNCKCIKD